MFAAYGATPGAPLMRVPAVGGVPTAVTALEKDEMWHSGPQFLPDGRHLLYFAVNKEAENGAIYVQELGTTKRLVVLKSTTRGVWAPPGYLLFVREGTLFLIAQAWSPDGSSILCTASAGKQLLQLPQKQLCQKWAFWTSAVEAVHGAEPPQWKERRFHGQWRDGAPGINAERVTTSRN